MAEQSSRDVVDQTLSGGEPLPSDGPAPQAKATGLIGRYQARYFSGKNASGLRKYWTDSKLE